MSSADERTVLLDPDRTLLIPRPGGRATAAKKAPRAGAAAQGATLQHLVAGINPLLSAAGPLLALVAQLRATTHHADRPGLQRQLLGLIGEFEERARASGVTRPQVTAARYLLCTFIDEVIAATPWGADAPAGTRGLLQEFHEDESGAVKVFELLDKLSADAQAQAPLLELFYVCFALGFEGQYANKPGGRAELDALAARLLQRVRPGAQAPDAARTLSQRWAGEVRRAPTLTVVPLWLTIVVGAALVLGALMWMSTRLSRQAAPVLQQLHDMHRTLAAAPPAAPVAKGRVAPLLADDLAGGALDVTEDAQRSVITLGADALFVAGSAQVQPAQRERLARVAKALAALPGRIEVLGHTDDEKLESLRFPSNWHLSRERAQAAAAVLADFGVPPQRLRAEGRAETEPRVPNDSASARARNRRIEILLLLPRPES